MLCLSLSLSIHFASFTFFSLTLFFFFFFFFPAFSPLICFFFVFFALLLSSTDCLLSSTLVRIHDRQFVPYLEVMDQLLKEYVPRVQRHLHDLQIQHDLFLVDWILTIYSRALPLDVACRVWDVFLLEGDCVLFRVALGLFRMYQTALVKMDFEQTIAFVRALPPTMSDKELFTHIHAITLTPKHYAEVCDRHIHS